MVKCLVSVTLLGEVALFVRCRGLPCTGDRALFTVLLLLAVATSSVVLNLFLSDFPLRGFDQWLCLLGRYSALQVALIFSGRCVAEPVVYG